MIGKTRPTRIHLLGDGRHEEGVADTVITPGMLIALQNESRLIPHDQAGKPAELNFALEDALQGRTIEDDYAEGDLVGYVSCNKGDVVLAWLADGETVEDGDLLVSNGDGRLAKSGGSDSVLAVALEAHDLTESSNSTAARIRVRVL